MVEQDCFVFNGIHRRTGQLWAPELAGQAAPTLHKVVPPWIDRNDLEQCGWGLVLAKTDPDAAKIREALAPLVDKRREDAKGRLVELECGPHMTGAAFRRRYRDLYTRFDATRTPYYLLLASDPRYMSFSFQSDLAASHAIGRLHFANIEQYAHYARSVVAEETAPSRPRRAVIWAADHPHDHATRLTTKVLTRPVAEEIRTKSQGFEIDAYLSREATKISLRACLGQEAPAFLFTSGHGLFFDPGDEDQRKEQGSLVCGDWSGPNAGPPDENQFFSAADLDAAGPRGLISFHFACNSAGTPELDNFYFQVDSRARPRLAPVPFVSALAQSMLGHSGGGSLAFVGHVDRTWLNTFLWRSYGGKPHVYADLIEALLRGYRIGTALHLFSQVTAEISTDFVRKILEHTGPYDPKRKAVKMLGQISDLQGFVILGDPAVRIAASNACGVPEKKTF